ncbi:MAG: bifunctional diaminohydroxyphosphoribosylaminopyrimidine deaminase/5-amino-6-(5-phosphoribosylamino)uracil reductase RibD [Bacteroidetes bacterium]|nr:bifunctional diaminohydroxyphosphoribosylaminopyrimidine deaminase/5-amino-6-(5-phosphoribosylamino)uracil reductase RibD [Bacteroidota bacterium]
MNDKGVILSALKNAANGFPAVLPNPMVGCVIVCNEEIVAEGYHQKFGEAHAEVNAINNLKAGVDPSECTLYVTLEPCTHFGKTPPCADLIIEKGFKKVVVCNHDPNPLVSGRGIEKLRKAGIEVITGVMEEEGRALNKRFFTFHEKKRPYVILKWAQTADGYISRLPVPENREENIISTPDHQKMVHRMRSEEVAIMVGKNTVMHDNPKLTTRLVKGKNPVRIFIDQHLEVPLNFNIYNKEAETIVFNGKKNEIVDNIKFLQIDFNGHVLKHILDKLYQMNIQSILVEGGSKLLNYFIEDGIYDELSVFENKELVFGKGIKAPSIKNKPH